MNPRIIAGMYKNLTLDVPKTSRPITDRVKRSLFDTLIPVLENAICLDLFAGTGSIGIEAISRGAQKCTFVENSEEAYEILNNNLKSVDDSQYETIKQKSETYLSKESSRFDIVFIDPPFDKIEKFDYSMLKSVLKEEGIVVLKIEKNQKVNLNGFKIVKESSIGINKLIYFR